MSITGSPRDEILVLTVVLCGVACVGGYLLTFALSRRLVEGPARPVIGLGELVKPLACGMLVGLAILVFRLSGPAGDTRIALQVAPQLSVVLSALLAVGLIGVCGGGWTARLRAGRTPIAAADLVRRLCVAGNTHEDATARIAVRIALAAGYDPAGASDLLAAASLHDVGHAGIPSAILDKGDRLDAAERRVLQNHTRIGHRMLARSHEPMLDLAADIALHHHERWDGGGYPAGLAGEGIPLTSRAMALAESFDRLLSARDAPVGAFADGAAANSNVAAGRASPGEGASEQDALDEAARWMRQDAGARFDPRLVKLLLADLAGMAAARSQGPAGARPSTGRSLPAWHRPGRFRPLPGAAAT